MWLRLPRALGGFSASEGESGIQAFGLRISAVPFTFALRVPDPTEQLLLKSLMKLKLRHIIAWFQDSLAIPLSIASFSNSTANSRAYAEASPINQ